MTPTEQRSAAIEEYYKALAHANGADYREKNRLSLEYRNGYFYIIRNGHRAWQYCHGMKQLRECIAILHARPRHAKA
jgi:hypothetical protein